MSGRPLSRATLCMVSSSGFSCQCVWSSRAAWLLLRVAPRRGASRGGQLDQGSRLCLIRVIGCFVRIVCFPHHDALTPPAPRSKLLQEGWEEEGSRCQWRHVLCTSSVALGNTDHIVCHHVQSKPRILWVAVQTSDRSEKCTRHAVSVVRVCTVSHQGIAKRQPANAAHTPAKGAAGRGDASV